MTSAGLQEKTLPTVWDEKKTTVDFSDLKEGYLVKIHLDNVNLPETELIGIYRGIKDSDRIQNFILETEGVRLIANTAGRLCKSQLHKFYLPWMRLVEILARDHHAVFELFHALGGSRCYYKNAKDRIEQAQACLNDMSKLNLFGR